MPERVECLVEHRQVVATVHEQCAAGVVHSVAAAEIDVLERFDHVHEAPDVHLQSERTQEASEQENVCDQVWHHDVLSTSCAARATSAARPAPETVSMSSFALSATPSVASTASVSRECLSSATSAATQSSVSDTP